MLRPFVCVQHALMTYKAPRPMQTSSSGSALPHCIKKIKHQGLFLLCMLLEWAANWLLSVSNI